MSPQIILTLNLMEDSILLNEGVLDALDWPRQVQILINKEEKMLLLRACTIDDQQAVVVPEERAVQFEISGRSTWLAGRMIGPECAMGSIFPPIRPSGLI